MKRLILLAIMALPLLWFLLHVDLKALVHIAFAALLIAGTVFSVTLFIFCVKILKSL